MDLAKNEHHEEQQAFLSSHPDEDVPIIGRKRSHTVLWYLRIVLEFSMATTIALFLIYPYSNACIQKIKPSPVPVFPRKLYTFVENPKYLHENMFVSREETLHTLHNWIELSADGRGYTQIGDSSLYDLTEPYIVAVNRTDNGPAYMVSVFHQLHCLSYIVQHFQAGYGKVNLTQEVAHHSAHCFDYLRQSIMCSADTSLEGKTEAGPGWGSEHECIDYDAMLGWANEHTAQKWRNLMPEEAVL